MENILVIEDDPAIREGIGDFLKMEGFAVRTAKNGKVGLQLAEEQTPTLIICDIRMPIVDGYDVLRVLRNDQKTVTTPFIFLTANDGRENQRLGMELGADDFITKPFTPDELLAAVDTQLRKRQVISQKYEYTLSLLRQNIIYALPHELRTPLTLIMAYADMLIEDADIIKPDDLQKWADTILRASQRLHRTMENYLVYVQLELVASDKKALVELRNHITADAAEVIKKAAGQVATEMGRPEDLRLDLTKLALQIAEDDLEKIVAEIAGNAFKFSEVGKKVKIKSVREGNAYSLIIEDKGRGMTREQIDNIGAYMQFERALYEQQGLGLGLAIARRLVELHLGTFQVESNPGEGTTMTIRFPLP